MDDSFVRLIRAATKGSSTVNEAASRSTTRRVSGRKPSDLQSAKVRMQLTEVDGILQWEETTGALPDLGRFRSRGVSVARDPDAVEIEFNRLAPSKVTEFLVKRDARLTPHRGLRRFDPETDTFVPAEFPDSGTVLLLIHGTFSNSEGMLSGMFESDEGKRFLKESVGSYDGQVYVFDHPTLAVSPILNAFDLQQAIGASEASIDFVSHSRGGLVSRWWCETFDPDGVRCRKSILVGSPLAGTGLAAPTNIRDAIDVLSQFSRALQIGSSVASMGLPVFSIVETLLRVVTSITSLTAKAPVADAAMAMIPGLAAMSRVGNNPELNRLLDRSVKNAERYYAVSANFQPTDPAWKFWRLFRKDRVVNAAADVLFQGDNDLVVDTRSMTHLSAQKAIAKKRTLDFGDSQTVHHLNYFQQTETIRFLGDVLL